MKLAVLFSAISVLALLWSGYSVTCSALPFPEPMQGYHNEPVGYDDVPPDNPALIELGTFRIGMRSQKLQSVPSRASSDGLEFVGKLHGITSKRAKVVCMAVDFTRRCKHEQQLITSHSEFFELDGGETAFRLPIRFPDYSEAMYLNVVGQLLDEDGVSVGPEFTVAYSEYKARP